MPIAKADHPNIAILVPPDLKAKIRIAAMFNNLHITDLIGDLLEREYGGIEIPKGCKIATTMPIRRSAKNRVRKKPGRKKKEVTA